MCKVGLGVIMPEPVKPRTGQTGPRHSVVPSLSLDRQNWPALPLSVPWKLGAMLEARNMHGLLLDLVTAPRCYTKRPVVSIEQFLETLIFGSCGTYILRPILSGLTIATKS